MITSKYGLRWLDLASSYDMAAELESLRADDAFLGICLVLREEVFQMIDRH